MAQELTPFWAGARALARQLDLRALAEDAGGWPELAAAGRAGLAELGVPADVVSLWLDRPPEHTRGRALTLADPDYPPRLAALPDAPPVICVEGSVDVLVGNCVAVVGTRACSSYGAAVARHAGAALARRQGVVVSGLARGIDGHAHRAALATCPESTVAVLGHGLGCTSPVSHTHLRRQIVEQGGALISSLPDEHRPTRWTFPQRNRWIAALSVAVVIVEAPLKSGALITATEAADLDRPLYAVPAALGQPVGAGCLSLLADGANVVFDVEEMASSILGEPDQLPLIDPLLEHLVGGPTASQVSKRAGLPVTEVLARLARLEVQGHVVRLPGQRFVPTRGR